MRLTSNELFKAVRYALYAGASAVVGLSAAPVFAQDTAQQDQNTQGEKLETITVTGSNIRRVDIETANPVITIDRAQIEQSGKLTIGDLVQELPSIAGAATNPQVNNGGGGGTSTVSLRGLGSVRTLILVDGQRVLNNDINTIPASVVERIEVLKDGASSVYGSDAIGGVVNFIMRKDYQGAEFTGDYGISDKDDGERRGASLTFGQTTDRGSVVAGLNYNKFDAVSAGKRDFSRDALYYYSAYGGALSGGSSRTPTGRIFLPPNLADQFGCSSVTRIAGTDGSSLDNYRCFTGNDFYNYQPLNVILTPQERTNAFALANYRLTDNVSAYFKYFGNKTVASSLIAPYPLDSLSNNIVTSADNLYNPFGVDFGPSPNGTLYNLSERLTGVGQRITTNTGLTNQFVAGLKGNVGDTSWTWDANLNYGHFSQEGYTTGYLNFTKLADALGPSAIIGGVPTCLRDINDPTSAIPGCVPLNIFVQDDPNSVAQFLAAQSAPFTKFTTIQREASINTTGELFDLPAGAVSLAVGALYRKTYANFKLDSTLVLDLATGTCDLGTACGTALNGNTTTKEAYAEVLIPILKDVPFFHALNVDIGTRYSKIDPGGNTTNSKLAVEWRPIEDLLLRGTVSEVFRAPNTSELFAGAFNDAATFQDPCVGYISPGAHEAACGVPTGATNIPPGGIAQPPNFQTNGIASGAVAAGFSLKPESGKSFDFGVVYDPSWLPGLSVNTDIYRIYLTDTITGITAQNVANICYNDGTSPFCAFITRRPDGQIDQIKEPTVNLGRLDTSGVDFGFTYRLPQFNMFGHDPGNFAIGVEGTYIKTFNNSPGAGAATLHNAGVFSNQFGNFPRVRGLGHLDWTLGPFEASWRVRYIGNVKIGSPDLSQGLSADGGIPGFVRHIGAVTYHDFTFGYTVEPINTKFQIGIDNAFNKLPPFFYQNVVTNANTDVRTYDTVGRFYFARATVKF
ncbi:MAG: TonB-dependent receptor [Rhodanobacteraceae bacterium]